MRLRVLLRIYKISMLAMKKIKKIRINFKQVMTAYTIYIDIRHVVIACKGFSLLFF